MQYTESLDATITHRGENKGLSNLYSIKATSFSITSEGSGPDGKQSAVWQGSLGSLKVTKIMEFSGDDLFFTTTVTLTNEGSEPVNDVYYMRSVDPDQGEWHGDGFKTKNWVEFQR